MIDARIFQRFYFFWIWFGRMSFGRRLPKKDVSQKHRKCLALSAIRREISSFSSSLCSAPDLSRFRRRPVNETKLNYYFFADLLVCVESLAGIVMHMIRTLSASTFFCLANFFASFCFFFSFLDSLIGVCWLSSSSRIALCISMRALILWKNRNECH